jgi:hypothetical protein
MYEAGECAFAQLLILSWDIVQGPRVSVIWPKALRTLGRRKNIPSYFNYVHKNIYSKLKKDKYISKESKDLKYRDFATI